MIATKNTAPSPTELKSRVLAIRAQLPKDVRALVIKEHSEYDTAAGGRKLNNVLSGASSDEKLTIILESLAQPVAA
ncbi:hypothetical protein [Hymenobacter properus]|uniref:Uncharacterized protein n=1 Tax=Hymenobacter properus TaxID=2791026 RepID=A0A931BEH4_9BACT|nr:hypothetical protein [Hymenobacter properus]MBF9140807.1 hypothetical protein [Hymenobacter properus]MBR7719616.1 hypothetical protein [Microvirga sp. SRT04]